MPGVTRGRQLCPSRMAQCPDRLPSFLSKLCNYIFLGLFILCRGNAPFLLPDLSSLLPPSRTEQLWCLSTLSLQEVLGGLKSGVEVGIPFAWPHSSMPSCSPGNAYFILLFLKYTLGYQLQFTPNEAKVRRLKETRTWLGLLLATT